MSLGSGLPYCWLCSNFRRDDRYCRKHLVVVPVTKGLSICADFSNTEFEVDRWYLDFRKAKLNSRDLYVYAENSNWEEYIPFEKLSADLEKDR